MPFNCGLLQNKISYFLFQKGRTGQQPQSDQSKTKHQQCKNSMPNIWDPLRIFWAPPKGLGHFSSSTLTSTHSLTARLRPVPLHSLLLLLVAIPWYWHPNAGSPAATGLHFHQQPLLGSRRAKSQPSPSPLNPGLSTATPAAPSPTASSGLSWCQTSAALHDPFHVFKTSITWVTLTHVRV